MFSMVLSVHLNATMLCLPSKLYLHLKTTLKSQVFEKTHVLCRYLSSDSTIYYDIFSRKGNQTKKSL
jgi:hypothetical protein